jgi:hypothetical protein
MSQYIPPVQFLYGNKKKKPKHIQSTNFQQKYQKDKLGKR